MKANTALRSAMAQEMISDMAKGTTNPNPVIQIYSGSMPSSMGGTVVNTLLATLTLTTSVATESNGIITFEAITEDPAANDTARAVWCRVLDRDGTESIYMTVNDNGSGEINFNSADLVTGSPVAIGELVLTIGGV